MKKIDVSQNRHIAGGQHDDYFVTEWVGYQGNRVWDEERKFNVFAQNWCFFSGWLYHLNSVFDVHTYMGIEYCYKH